MPDAVFTLLGCGSSGGVPRIGNNWGHCDPLNSRNRRRRCSLLIELHGPNGTTRALIDSSPDLREQLLSAQVDTLDGVLYTHAHADHVNGLDDLRVVYINRRMPVPVWADRPTCDALLERFSYAFSQPEESPYPAILKLNELNGPVTVEGAGGPIKLTPFPVCHGQIDSLGYRIGRLAYLPDVSDIYPDSWKFVEHLDCWIVDSLRRAPHPSHTHLDNTLSWISQVAPRRAVLTNMHTDLDYQTVLEETPSNVEPGYDGWTATYEI